MDELSTLREHIEAEDYDEALLLIEELEAMSKEDKLQKIRSYLIILLVHLIKQEAEQRTTRSWDFSVRNAAREIKYVNKRRKSGGYYASEEELQELIEEAYPTAIDKASLEAFEGMHTEAALEAMIDVAQIKAQALAWVLEE
jgi:hypothetical protein